MIKVSEYQKFNNDARPWLPPLPFLVTLVVFVYLSAWISAMISQETSHISTIWLPNGIVVGFLLFSHPRVWPSYIALGTAANLAANLFLGDTIVSALFSSLANTLEIFAAVWPWWNPRAKGADLSQSKDFFKFVLFSMSCAPAISALFATIYFGALGNIYGLEGLTRWFMAHALGIALTTPLCLGFLRGEVFSLFKQSKAPKTVILLLLPMVVTGAVFYQTRYPFLFFIPPFLMIATFIQGFSGVILCMPFLTFAALVGTMTGRGPFALTVQASFSEKIILAQMFVLINFVMLSFVANIATEMRRVTTKLSELARIDGLTNIANRRYFDEVLSKEWRRAQREQKPLSLLLLDVDHFKAYNDFYGHQGGDHCLSLLAQDLSNFAHRPGDLAARYGGEELALILPGCAEVDAKRIAENIRQSIISLKMPHTANADCGSLVTASIGVATCYPLIGDRTKDPEYLISLADKALYEAKRMGRNQVVAWHSVTNKLNQISAQQEEERVTVVDRFVAGAPHYSEELNNIAYLAATMLQTPIGLVSLVGKDKQIFLGRYGLETESTSRDISFCAHTLDGNMPLVIGDATIDPRFKDNALVTGDLGVRFYAGAPLMVSADGTHLGALCIVDQKPRPKFDDEQRKLLTILAALAMKCMESKLERLPREKTSF